MNDMFLFERMFSGIGTSCQICNVSYSVLQMICDKNFEIFDHHTIFMINNEIDEI